MSKLLHRTLLEATPEQIKKSKELRIRVAKDKARGVDPRVGKNYDKIGNPLESEAQNYIAGKNRGGVGAMRGNERETEAHENARGFKKITGESERSKRLRAFGFVNASTEYSGISLHEMLLETTRDEHGNKIGSAEDRAALAKAIWARRKEKGVKYKKNAEGKNHIVLGASGDEKTAETPAALVTGAASRVETLPAPDNETPEARNVRLGAGRDAVRDFIAAGNPNRTPSKGGAGNALSVGDVFSDHVSNLLKGKDKEEDVKRAVKAKARAVNASTEYRGSSLHEMLLSSVTEEKVNPAVMLAAMDAANNAALAAANNRPDLSPKEERKARRVIDIVNKGEKPPKLKKRRPKKYERTHQGSGKSGTYNNPYNR